MWVGTHADVEYDVCLADVASRVYSDSSVGITSLELGADATTLELDEADAQNPRFLKASDDDLMQLVKVISLH